MSRSTVEGPLGLRRRAADGARQPFVARAARSGSDHARHGALLGHRRAWDRHGSCRNSLNSAAPIRRRSSICAAPWKSRTCCAWKPMSRCNSKNRNAPTSRPCGSDGCTSIRLPRADTSRPTALPKSLDEIRQHRLVHQQGAADRGGRACSACSACRTSKRMVALRTNASIAHCLRDRTRHRALAALPTYLVGARHRSHSCRHRRSPSGRHLDDLSSGCAQHRAASRSSSIG